MKFLVFVFIIAVVIYLYRRYKNQKKNNLKEIYRPNNNANTVIEEKTTEPKENLENKTWGKFNVVGFHHLPKDAKNLIWKELKVGDELYLIPDPNNKYDNNAIKVIFNEQQIGWIPKDLKRKKELFNLLIQNKKIKVTCTENYRKGDYTRMKDSNGNWKDEYLGMAQFVEVKFEYLKN